jgi:hypothetical protein
MLALPEFKTVDGSRKIQIDIPQEFGFKLEILIFPVDDNLDSLHISVNACFLNKVFEDDHAGDAIWQRYITEKKL